MPSLQSYVVNPVISLLVKRKLARGSSGDPAADAKRVRQALGTPVLAPPGGKYRKDIVGGVAGLWTEPAASPIGTVLYLHGGGYIACSPSTHKPFTYAYAKRGLRVFAPNYRKAPEQPYPAAVEDGLAVYKALLTQGVDTRRFVVSGDSAGGGLTLATLLAARREGLPMPACAVLFSPWTDLACTGASLKTNLKSDPMIYGGTVHVGAGLYLGGADACDPLASPLYADLAGLPPLAIHASAIESLRDDATRLATRAREAGVEVSIKLWDGMPHVWPLFQTLLPEARQTMDEVGEFVRSKIIPS